MYIEEEKNNCKEYNQREQGIIIIKRGKQNVNNLDGIFKKMNMCVPG